MTSITETVRSTAQGMAKTESADKNSAETVDAVSRERIDASQAPEASPSEVQLSGEVAKTIEATPSSLSSRSSWVDYRLALRRSHLVSRRPTMCERCLLIMTFLRANHNRMMLAAIQAAKAARRKVMERR